MALFHLALLLLAAVLVSAILEQVVPRVSLPLVQVAMGLVIALAMGTGVSVSVDPELFLVLFIAPLLFDESRHVAPRTLWANRGAILSLAVGLVVATMLAVGFALHLVVPDLPLAAAFALGAAVGPTDAAAVSALSKDVSIGRRTADLLCGESLLNDATGVVSFQFAVAAAVTGAFSLVDATATFLYTFVGGVAVGVALGFVSAGALRMLRRTGLESTTVHVAFEVLAPFVVFIAAEEVGVSGILAVVAAGIVMAAAPRGRTTDAARMGIASSNVWELFTFIINGVVFVLLGMELPWAVSPSWRSPAISNWVLLAAVAVACTAVVGMRLAWTLAMEARRAKGTGTPFIEVLRDAAVLTFAGPKGAISLSIAFTIPYLAIGGAPFPERSTLVFIASSVVVVTLLLANFVVPIIAPLPKDEEALELDRARLAVLGPVVRGLAHQPKGPAAVRVARRFVLRSYGDRISRVRSRTVSPSSMVSVRLKMLARQREAAEAAEARGVVPAQVAERYLRHVAELEHMVERNGGRRGGVGLARRKNPLSVRGMARALGDMLRNRLTDDEYARELRALVLEGEEAALVLLEELSSSPDTNEAEAARLLAADHRTAIQTLRDTDWNHGFLSGDHPAPLGARNLAAMAQAAGVPVERVREHVCELTAEGLRLELAEIGRLADEGAVTRGQAAELREEVYVLQLGLGES